MPITPGASPTEVNLGNSPAAEAGQKLADWQAGAAYPDPNNPQLMVRDVSAQFPNIGGIDARTTVTETIALASQGKLVTLSNAGAIAATLDSAAVAAGFFCAIAAIGAGTATLTPSAGTINGAASLAITTNHGCLLFFDGTNWEALTLSSAITGAVGITIDGGGSTPATGSKGYIQVDYNATITGWTLLADQAGSAQITVKKSTYAGLPTTASIVASAPPNLSSQQKNMSTTLTGWTTAITAGDVLEFNLDSVTTCKRLTLELQLTKS